MSRERSSEAAPAIQVKGATAAYRSCNSAAVPIGPSDLEITSGEFLSLVGPGGCGKSTLLKMIAGLMPLSSGEIRIAGHRVETIQTDLGMVFAEPVLLGWRTAFENVLLQAEMRGLDLRAGKVEARRLLIMLGLSGYEQRRPHELSPAMAQRVSICRALIHHPPLLLMDDPCRDLDPLAREQMSADLQRLRLTPRMTVVLATSDIGEAVLLSDRVAVMSAGGRIQQYLTVELTRPRRLDKAMTPQIAEYCNAIRTLFRAQGILR